MTPQESGRKGGEATFARYGSDHYSRLAHLRIAKEGAEVMRRIGKKGGNAYVQRYIIAGGHPWSAGKN